MDGYYQKQASMPYFTGAARQRGSGLGALATNVGRFAFPLFKNILIPAAKQFATDLALEAAPELINLADGESDVRKAPNSHSSVQQLSPLSVNAAVVSVVVSLQSRKRMIRNL